MKKKIFNKISIILLCLLCLNTLIPMAAERVELKNSTPHDIYTACLEEGMNVDAKSAILIEPVTGTVLYEKNPDEKFAPASVTKIMTMLLAMEAIDSGKISLDDKITCSENAKSMGGSTMLLDTGEVRTVEDILKGIAIASGNDAAVAMAEFLSGSTDEFVKVMNERAKELGMTNTTFKNCNGLPMEGHLTTARDISIMSLELLKHPTILKYSGTYMETISEGRKSPIELVNHNKLVRFFDGCDGLKTGFTQEAKYCISATAVRNGVRMLAVMNNHIGYSLIDMTQIFERLGDFDMCSYVRNFIGYIYKALNKSDIDTFALIWNDAADKAFAEILGKRQLEIIKEAGNISTFIDKDSQMTLIQSVICELNEELDVVKTNAAGKMKAYIVTGISAGLILVIVLI